MQTAFRPRDHFTRPLSSEPTSGCEAENEIPVDLAITVTVVCVVRYFQDSKREAITGDGLCPSGKRGPRTPSWSSYGLDSVPCVLLRSNFYSPVVARTIYDQYTVVRFYAGHSLVTLRDLDQVAQSLSYVVHIIQLNNGRWEIFVWKGYINERCSWHDMSSLNVDEASCVSSQYT